MKNIFLLTLCIFTWSCNQQPSSTAFENTGGTPQVLPEDTTIKKCKLIVPSAFGFNLLKESRFQGEKLDTFDERYIYGVIRRFHNDHFKIDLHYLCKGTLTEVVVHDLFANTREIRNYYENGNLRSILFNTLEAPLGTIISRVYYENGELKQIPSGEVWGGCYENGKLIEGTLFRYYDTEIGTWKYYAEDGKLDSIVDHDQAYRVPYVKAMQIAKTNGFVMPGLGVSRQLIKGRDVWEIVRCSGFNGVPAEEEQEEKPNGSILLIDAQTGKIIKPGYFVDCSSTEWKG